MRAFPFILVVAMLGAISLATVGAISTVSQTGHNAIAFGLAGGSALARKAYDGQPAPSRFMPVPATDTAHAGKAIAGGDR
jgi:hypothetical protein